MKTKSVTVYEFKELSDKAKEVAINWYREASNGDCFVWDNIKEDANNIGLKLDGMDRGSMTGDFIQSARVCSESIIREHGKDCETYKTASVFEKAWETLSDTDDDGREELETEFLRSILEDYRIMQEKDEEYQNSDEYIIETIEANDYEFLESGKRA